MLSLRHYLESDNTNSGPLAPVQCLGLDDSVAQTAILAACLPHPHHRLDNHSTALLSTVPRQNSKVMD